MDKYIDEIARRIASHVMVPAPPSGFRNRRLLTFAQAAEYIGRSENAVKQLIQKGRLPITSIDSKTQIDKVELDRLIEARTHFRVGDRT